jgi:hypothetical protein
LVFGDIATDVMLSLVVSIKLGVRVSRSQTRTVRSPPPDAMVSPSLAKSSE